MEGAAPSLELAPPAGPAGLAAASAPLEQLRDSLLALTSSLAWRAPLGPGFWALGSAALPQLGRSCPAHSPSALRGRRQRPDWLPRWADVADPDSDMRRWILPFVIGPFAISQVVRASVVDPLLAEQLARRSAIFALSHEQEEAVERNLSKAGLAAAPPPPPQPQLTPSRQTPPPPPPPVGREGPPPPPPPPQQQ